MNNNLTMSVVIAVTDEIESLRYNVLQLMETCTPDEIVEIVFAAHSKTTNETKSEINNIIALYSNYRFVYFEQKGNTFGCILSETLPLLNGSHVVYCVADNATDMRQVKRFINELKSNPFCVVCSSRWISGGRFEGYGTLRKHLNHLFQKIVALIYSTSFTDFSFSYMAVPVDLYRSINIERTDMSVFLECHLKMLRLGIPMKEISAIWRNRAEGKRAIRLGRLFSYLHVVFMVRFEPRDRLLREH